jgi:histidinol-phosphate phosphatase family protein
MRPALFLDKDGTLVKDVPYNSNPTLLQLSENSISGLAAIQEAGFSLFIVSNQPGVALGYFEERDLGVIKEALTLLLHREGLRLEDCYFCPHRSDATLPEYRRDCECRKPKPGMLLKAARQYDLRLSHSWMIGDILDDIEAGKRAGCRTILINNGNETEWRIERLERQPDFMASSIDEACEIVLRHHRLGEGA